jgi:hypothetical protein
LALGGVARCAYLAVRSISSGTAVCDRPDGGLLAVDSARPGVASYSPAVGEKRSAKLPSRLSRGACARCPASSAAGPRGAFAGFTCNRTPPVVSSAGIAAGDVPALAWASRLSSVAGGAGVAAEAALGTAAIGTATRGDFPMFRSASCDGGTKFIRLVTTIECPVDGGARGSAANLPPCDPVAAGRLKASAKDGSASFSASSSAGTGSGDGIGEARARTDGARTPSDSIGPPSSGGWCVRRWRDAAAVYGFKCSRASRAAPAAGKPSAPGRTLNLKPGGIVVASATGAWCDGVPVFGPADDPFMRDNAMRVDATLARLRWPPPPPAAVAAAAARSWLHETFDAPPPPPERAALPLEGGVKDPSMLWPAVRSPKSGSGSEPERVPPPAASRSTRGGSARASSASVSAASVMLNWAPSCPSSSYAAARRRAGGGGGAVELELDSDEICVESPAAPPPP